MTNGKSFALQALVQLDLSSSLLTKNRKSKLREKLIEQFGNEDTHLVVRVIDLPEDEVIGNGHPQKIVLINKKGTETVLSGAYFKRYAPKEVPSHLQAYEEMCSKKED